MLNFTIFQEEIGVDFGRVLREGLIDIFVGEGEDTRDTRAGNANKNGEIWFATIE
jgi:hypothetical protein